MRRGRVRQRVIIDADKPIRVEVQNALHHNMQVETVLQTGGVQHYSPNRLIGTDAAFAKDASASDSFWCC